MAREGNAEFGALYPWCPCFSSPMAISGAIRAISTGVVVCACLSRFQSNGSISKPYTGNFGVHGTVPERLPPLQGRISGVQDYEKDAGRGGCQRQTVAFRARKGIEKCSASDHSKATSATRCKSGSPGWRTRGYPPKPITLQFYQAPSFSTLFVSPAAVWKYSNVLNGCW